MPAARKSQGFTLIEIVLVLAIAGLLIITVFLAVSGAQRSRRDYQRKQDLAEFTATIATYAANHAGRPPQDQSDLDTFMTTYFKHSDPLTGSIYTGDFNTYYVDHDQVGVPARDHITYVEQHVCGADSTFPSPTLVTDPPNWQVGVRTFAALIGLEAGQAYCLDSDN